MNHQKKPSWIRHRLSSKDTVKWAHNCSSSLWANIIILFSYAFHLALSPQCPPRWRPLSPSENPSECVEASFFTLPLGLCCQRAALRKSLFLPGRASCVPPPSPSVLMAVPPTCWDPDPSRGRASAGDNYCCSPALIIWPHGSITADHMFQQTRRRSKERKEEELE